MPRRYATYFQPLREMIVSVLSSGAPENFVPFHFVFLALFIKVLVTARPRNIGKVFWKFRLQRAQFKHRCDVMVMIINSYCAPSAYRNGFLEKLFFTSIFFLVKFRLYYPYKIRNRQYVATLWTGLLCGLKIFVEVWCTIMHELCKVFPLQINFV